MAIALSSKELEGTIEVLSSAARALRLSRFEQLSYWGLIAGVDMIAVAIFGLFLTGIAEGALHTAANETLFGIFVAAWFGGLVLGTTSLTLSIPLFRRVLRERAKLKKLDLDSLSRSLWKAGQPGRWIIRAHGIVLLIVCALMVFSAAYMVFHHEEKPRETGVLAFTFLTFFISISLLFATRYLQNQRTRMDLTSNAEELRGVLMGLKREARDVEIVTVPSELLEQTAKIESVQIAQERRDAVLQSLESRTRAYAVAFDRAAVEQRATLDIVDRVELEDLLADLSADRARREVSRTAAIQTRHAKLGDETGSGRVRIEYAIDDEARIIRVTAVSHGDFIPRVPPAGGASHA